MASLHFIFFFSILAPQRPLLFSKLQNTRRTESTIEKDKFRIVFRYIPTFLRTVVNDFGLLKFQIPVR